MIKRNLHEKCPRLNQEISLVAARSSPIPAVTRMVWSHSRVGLLYTKNGTHSKHRTGMTSDMTKVVVLFLSSLASSPSTAARIRQLLLRFMLPILSSLSSARHGHPTELYIYTLPARLVRRESSSTKRTSAMTMRSSTPTVCIY